MNNDDFTVLVSGDGRRLSEHMYCVAIAFKMTEQVEKSYSASYLALSLNIPP